MESGRRDLAYKDSRHSPPGTFVRCITSCSILRSRGVVDVLAPALSVRRLCTPLPEVIDLSLARSLRSLLLQSGGFDCSTELTKALGLRSPAIALEAAAEDTTSSALFGALLVLKTAATFFSESWDAPLTSICNRASAFCCSFLHISEAKLWACLQNVDTPFADLSPLPASAVAILRANFGTRVLWSQCDFWMPLLSTPAQNILQSRGGVICPRNFLVELATVARCTYDYHEKFFLYKQKGQLFVGTVAEDNFCFDAMRQGRQLEASVVSFDWMEEDRVIMETTLLNGLLVCYAGAPDALSAAADVPNVFLQSGDEAGYTAAGYELSQVFDGVEDGDLVRIWKAARIPVNSSDYVEVKKTTHLQGQCGEYKRSKFWMQAALAACGGVVVAMTGDSDDKEKVTTFTRYTLGELEGVISRPQDMWSELANHLQAIMEDTATSDGPWTLFLCKRRHGAVRLYTTPGWDGHEHLQDFQHITSAVKILSKCSTDAGHLEGGCWEMQCGRGWSTWKPDGLDFLGLPGEVHYFHVAGHDYRVVFGPDEGMGVQENLFTGRKRQLRLKDTNHENSTTTSEQEDIVQQLCDMGFSRSDVARSLDSARGNSARAVEALLSNM